MKFWIGVTDRDWFDHIGQLRPDEVNFWQPSGAREFRALQPGEPFLFKLHSPENFIVGGGYFVRHSALPTSLAWDAFGQHNGVATLTALRARVRRYRRDDSALDPVIGCNVLTDPFVLPREEWIAVPDSWARNIVQGKTYDTVTAEGASLWNTVANRVRFARRLEDSALDEAETMPMKFGAEYLVRARLGQGAFRVLVTDAYHRRCAVTGEKTLPVLDAAHIKPYSEHGPHRTANGILLRSDLHKLFDLGYVTVTAELRLEVSRQLRDDWQNGREYYAHHGQLLENLPTDTMSRPEPEFLRWHNENCFKS